MRLVRRLLLPAAGVLAGSLPAADVAPAPTAWEVYEVLHAACVECHGGHLAKPKAKLGYILDLARLIEEKYVVPGDPARSDLYTALITDDEDVLMPPPDSEGHRPTPDEIETIRAWIAAGAVTSNLPPDSSAIVVVQPATAAVPAHPVVRTIGRLHLVWVHFPIALLLAAALTEIGAAVRPQHAGWLHGTTRGSLWLGAAGSVFAVVTGWIHAAQEGFASAEADTHRWLGVATAVLALISLLVCELAERARARDVTRGSRVPLLAVLVISAVIVTLAGHTGGRLVWGADYLPW